MRYFEPAILEEIKRELAFIWAIHRMHGLEGKMRLYSTQETGLWKSHEAGYEFWFGAGEIEQAIEKIEFFYRGGETPNTPLFLDPVVYKIEDGQPPEPVGCGLVWCTILSDSQPISEEAIKRVQDLGVYVTPIFNGDDQPAGIKIVGFLRDSTMPMNKKIPTNGSIVPGVQSLADLINVESDADTIRQYVISGLEYRTGRGVYQHPRFQDLFGEQQFTAAKDIMRSAVHLQHIRDAGTCWNAYERSPELYRRYGIDVANLDNNLKSLADSDHEIELITKELLLIWHAHQRHGLEGEMRLFTAPDQENWRSKEPGLEVWFTAETINSVIPHIKNHYNGGILPNSPLLLDPIVYHKREDGSHVPVGSGVAWCSAISTGAEEFDATAAERIHDLGLITGRILRSKDKLSGLKMLGFLDAPYVFGDDEIAQWNESQQSEDKEKAVPDALPIPACESLFAIANTNGENLGNYFMLTGLEYLCANGSFMCQQLQDEISDNASENEVLMMKYTVSQQTILDARTCWDSYLRAHSLWQRFGTDVTNLEHNLRFFQLCAEDFKLLDATGENRADKDDTFEFFVPGWIPKAAVTVIGATGGTGKSSLAHRLAVLASIDYADDEDMPNWLGNPLVREECKGLVIYFSGEDSAAIVNARAKMIDPEGRSTRLMLQRTDFGENKQGLKRSLSEFLEYLHKLPEVSLVVIDPARKYLEGDEDDSEVVSDFFEAIEEFAIKKNCGMVVVHHLQKQAHPKDTREILDLLRGSQVFIDRPRVVIGMMREGPYTVVGLAKNNIPPQLGMVEGERLFARDPERIDLIQLPGSKGVRSYDLSDEELEQLKQETELKHKEA